MKIKQIFDPFGGGGTVATGQNSKAVIIILIAVAILGIWFYFTTQNTNKQ